MKARAKTGTVDDYLTLDKEYEVRDYMPTGTQCKASFWITDDDGIAAFCLENNCGHLSGGSWELIEDESDNTDNDE